jgi:hypothetical protein
VDLYASMLHQAARRAKEQEMTNVAGSSSVRSVCSIFTSALETGLFLPRLPTMIGTIAAGRLVGRIGTRPVAVVGLIVAIDNAQLIGQSADGNVYVEALPGLEAAHRSSPRVPLPSVARVSTKPGWYQASYTPSTNAVTAARLRSQ